MGWLYMLGPVMCIIGALLYMVESINGRIRTPVFIMLICMIVGGMILTEIGLNASSHVK